MCEEEGCVRRVCEEEGCVRRKGVQCRKGV